MAADLAGAQKEPGKAVKALETAEETDKTDLTGRQHIGGGGGGGRNSGSSGGSGIVVLKVPTANYSGIPHRIPTGANSVGDFTIMKLQVQELRNIMAHFGKILLTT